ncbi:hypothetical protein DXG01_001304 [Tephrocybe rancida]|nr:hypothetical protein DXG01_001304 [Tephrocybe rancida]
MEPLPSPYSPPVHLLAEELGLGPRNEGSIALLSRIVMHRSTLATFTREPSEKLSIIAPSNPAPLNDDRIRTWAVSCSSTNSFSLTMREKPGGTVTGALFSITRKLQAVCAVLLEEALACVDCWACQHECLDPEAKYDVHLVLSTREPEVLLPLLEKVLLSHQHNAGNKDSPDLKNEKGFCGHSGALMELDSDVKEKEVYLCGPVVFEEAVLGILEDLGVDQGRVRREGFGY